jgi:hypothetical protein
MSSSQPFSVVETGPATLKEKVALQAFKEVVPKVEHLLAAPAPEVAQAPTERRVLPDIKQYLPTRESVTQKIKNNPYESAAIALTIGLLIANGFWAAAVAGLILAAPTYFKAPKFFKWATLASLVGLAFGLPQIALFTIGAGVFYWLYQALRDTKGSKAHA